MAYDVIAIVPFDVFHDATPEPEDLNSSTPLAAESLLARCRECGTTWVAEEVYVNPRNRHEVKFQELPNISCPKCQHDINPRAETTRRVDTDYSGSPELKIWTNGVSLVRSVARYHLVWRRKRLSKAVATTMAVGTYIWNKGRYYAAKQSCHISKTQTLHVLNVKKTGILAKTLNTVDGRIVIEKNAKKKALANITYKTDAVRSHLRTIFNLTFVPIGYEDNPLFSDFLIAVSNLLGVKLTSAEQISQAMLERFRPALGDIRFCVRDFKIFQKPDEETIERWGIRYNDWTRNRAGKRPVLRKSAMMKLSRKSSTRDALNVVLGEQIPRSVLKSIAAAHGDYLNWPLIRAILHGIKDPNYVCRILKSAPMERPKREENFTDDFSNMIEIRGLGDVLSGILQARGINHLDQFIRTLYQDPGAQRIGSVAVDILRMANDPQFGFVAQTYTASVATAYRAYSEHYEPRGLAYFHDWLIRARNRIWEQRRDQLREEELKMLNEPLAMTERFNFLATEHCGHKFILPEKAADLNDWGSTMHNCIGGYGRQMHAGKTLLVAVMNQNGKMVANLELGHTDDYTLARGHFKIKQVRGFCNAPLLQGDEEHKEINEAITTWMEHHEIEEDNI